MKYKFEFTLEEVKVILNALSRLPYDQVAKFIETIIQELNSQEKPEGGK
jgi:uncharacterized protein YjgD (DUF1641 family)